MNTKKKSLRAIARDLNISVMTLYRVLNNAPGVSKKMRQQVIVALDKAGVLQARNQAKQKVVIDVIKEPYRINLAESLVNKISDLNYEICFTNHKENRTAFLRQATEGNSIVFFSSPSQEILRAAKMENPDVFCINVCGSEVGDVIIGMHDYLGGTIAAEYLLQCGHRNIAVASIPIEPTQLNRHKSFMGELISFKKANKICELFYKGKDDIFAEEAIQLIREQKITAFFCTCDYLAFICSSELIKRGLRIPEDISVLSYDFPFGHIHRPLNLDTIGIDLDQMVRMAEYYLHLRPVGNMNISCHCLIAPELKIYGSVRKITEQEHNEITQSNKETNYGS